MNIYFLAAMMGLWAFVLVGCWLGWQLLRQNGRILLRLDELEKRLDELEFGGADEPEGLPVGSDAPAFELSDLAGERHALVQFRGQPLVLVFFNPACGFCRELAPKLAALAANSTPHPVGRGEGGRSPGEGNSDAHPLPLILTTGDADKNRQFFSENKVTCPVLVQKDTEVTAAYHAMGTPTGYLISAEGKIASELAVGTDALLALANGVPPSKSEIQNPKPEIDGRANRFSNRSVARSKIKRDGLKAGTSAPAFRLPRLDGGELSLEELRGKRVLLVFSDPHCGPCQVLAPELEKFHRENGVRRDSPLASDGRAEPQGRARHSVRAELPSATRGAQGTDAPHPDSRAIAVVMISRGEPKENRAKVKEHGLTFPVVLQQRWEISRLYARFATPMAYLIDKSGIITHDVAVGVEPILNLMASIKSPIQEREMAVDCNTPAGR